MNDHQSYFYCPYCTVEEPRFINFEDVYMEGEEVLAEGECSNCRHLVSLVFKIDEIHPYRRF